MVFWFGVRLCGLFGLDCGDFCDLVLGFDDLVVCFLDCGMRISGLGRFAVSLLV